LASIKRIVVAELYMEISTVPSHIFNRRNVAVVSDCKWKSKRKGRIGSGGCDCRVSLVNPVIHKIRNAQKTSKTGKTNSRRAPIVVDATTAKPVEMGFWQSLSEAWESGKREGKDEVRKQGQEMGAEAWLGVMAFLGVLLGLYASGAF
jgi:hypothetical protein